jgi:aryl-alcohol dehydrogenase-like predicted oxidoreductase
MPPSTITLGALPPIRRIGFGTLRLTARRGFGPARENAVDLLRLAVDQGVNFFDTADSYGPESAELAIRQALHPYHDLVIASKGGYEHDAENDWRENGRPEHLRRALEGSLTRLAVDRIDLYYLHTPDPKVPYEESLGALKMFHEEGKIRSAGVSRVDLAQFKQAWEILGDALVAVQNSYNVFYHQGYRGPFADDEEILSECEVNGLAYVAFDPLAPDLAYIPGVDDTPVRLLAERVVASVPRVMLAALLRRSEVIVAIPGTSRIDHLRENVTAYDLELDVVELEGIWRHYRPVGLARGPY